RGVQTHKTSSRVYQWAPREPWIHHHVCLQVLVYLAAGWRMPASPEHAHNAQRGLDSLTQSPEGEHQVPDAQARHVRLDPGRWPQARRLGPEDGQICGRIATD